MTLNTLSFPFRTRRFDIIKKLGQGTYGKVQLGINKETGQEVAIKTIKKSKIETEADLIRIRREVQIMSSVQHPNIIHIYEGELLGLAFGLCRNSPLYVTIKRTTKTTERNSGKLFNFPHLEYLKTIKWNFFRIRGEAGGRGGREGAFKDSSNAIFIHFNKSSNARKYVLG